MSTDAHLPRPQRVKERRGRFVAMGYSAGVAGALAQIDPDDVRAHIEARVSSLGVRDGAPRAYAVRLLASALKVGEYTSEADAPSALTPAESAFIQDRVNTVANELRKNIATARAEAKKRHEDEERARRHAETLERDLTR